MGRTPSKPRRLVVGDRTFAPHDPHSDATPAPDAVHAPVMVLEVLEALEPRPGGVYVDATVGLGGHAAKLLASFPDTRVVGLDVDPSAVALARARLAGFGDRATLLVGSFWQLAETVQRCGFTAVDGVLFDLGVSSLQLDTPARGFSFRHDAPLDMRFAGEGMTAAELLARTTEEEIAQILRDFGEEPAARRIARAIARARRIAPIETTGELRRLVLAATGGHRGRIDPATRTFQALRIATNRELEGIPPSLEQATHLLRPLGRLAVIAFHSLEDRLVKRTFRRLSGRCVCPPGSPFCTCSPETLLKVRTPRPLRPDEEEVAANPRARSARLRVAERSGP